MVGVTITISVVSLSEGLPSDDGFKEVHSSCDDFGLLRGDEGGKVASGGVGVAKADDIRIRILSDNEVFEGY